MAGVKRKIDTIKSVRDGELPETPYSKPQRPCLLGSIHTIFFAAGLFTALAFALDTQVVWVDDFPSV